MPDIIVCCSSGSNDETLLKMHAATVNSPDIASEERSTMKSSTSSTMINSHEKTEYIAKSDNISHNHAAL